MQRVSGKPSRWKVCEQLDLWASRTGKGSLLAFCLGTASAVHNFLLNACVN